MCYACGISQFAFLWKNMYTMQLKLFTFHFVYSMRFSLKGLVGKFCQMVELPVQSF